MSESVALGRRRLVAGCASLFALASWAAAGGSAGARGLAGVPRRPLAFEVQRSGDAIGTHTVGFSGGEAETAVLTDTAIEVRIAFVTVYRYRQTIAQTWRHGRLVGFETQTNDNGERTTVTGRANGDELVVEGPRGTVSAPGGVQPTGYWNRHMLGQSQLLDVGRGRLIAVATAPLGLHQIRIAGLPVETQLHKITGDLTAEVAYTGEGEWAGLTLQVRGNRIGYVRTS